MDGPRLLVFPTSLIPVTPSDKPPTHTRTKVVCLGRRKRTGGKKKKKKKKEETMQVGISRMCSCTILGTVIGLRRKPL